MILHYLENLEPRMDEGLVERRAMTMAVNWIKALGLVLAMGLVLEVMMEKLS